MSPWFECKPGRSVGAGTLKAIRCATHPGSCRGSHRPPRRSARRAAPAAPAIRTAVWHRLSARQSPSSQSWLACSSLNVVVISQPAPERRRLSSARRMLANDRCTRQSRHSTASARGRRVARDVGQQVAPAQLARRGALLQAFDDGRHDVDADVVDGQVDAMDPRRVATRRVEQRSHLQFAQQRRQPGGQRRRWPPARTPAPTPRSARPTGWCGGCARSARAGRAPGTTPGRPQNAGAPAPAAARCRSSRGGRRGRTAAARQRSDSARFTPRPANAAEKPRRSHPCTRGESTTARRNAWASRP